MEEDNTVTVDGDGRRAVVETKALLRASLPDVGQHLNQQKGVHLSQEQQLVTAPCRRH
uniref:Uncharacterized protein n=1 Tax=Oryza barthii TaxID=65489 RepID=A0A0D3GWL0_9ORYZ